MGKAKALSKIKMEREKNKAEGGKHPALTKAVKKIKKKGKGRVPKREQERLEGLSRGIILLQHIPHGFFEEEIKDFFSQFGKVMRVKVARSLKTGKSRGYAYVEFEFEEVAKIAAQSMNNYLMFERLIKCELLPDAVDRRKIFKNSYVREDKNPKLIARNKRLAEQEQLLPEDQEKEILQQRLDKLEQQNKRLAEMGIDYSFPVKAVERIKQVKTPVKFSPKLLRSKKSQGPLQQQTPINLNKEGKKTKSLNQQVQEIPKKKKKLDSPESNLTKIKNPETPKLSPKSLNRSASQQPETPSSLKKKGKKSKSPNQHETFIQETPKKEKKGEKPENSPTFGKTLKPETPKFTPTKLAKSPLQGTPASLKKDRKNPKSPNQHIQETPSKKKKGEKSEKSPTFGETLKPETPNSTPKSLGKSPLQQTPASLKKEKKNPKSPNQQLHETPNKKKKGEKMDKLETPKFSPKSPSKSPLQQQQTPASSKKKGKKSISPIKEAEVPVVKKKSDNSRKSLKDGEVKKKPEMPKFSPKLLRSRKGLGPQQLNTPESNKKDGKPTKTPLKSKTPKELPKISPKMLRSRKSDAAALTPMKEKPSGGAKKGRKSVF